MTAPMGKTANLMPALTRADVRHRLNLSRAIHQRGDETTALRLRESADIRPFDKTKFNPESRGGLPGNVAPTHRASEPRRPAAVLVPLVDRPEGFTVLFTQRTTHLKSHSGQISFPGGRLEPGDADAEAGALRETAEEIGLPAACIEVLGRLDPYLTVTGFEVTPVVGAVMLPFRLAPDPREVADVFEVPLAFLLDRANHQHHSRTIIESSGKEAVRAYYAIPFGDRYIWGATAGMLINLYEVLTANL